MEVAGRFRVVRHADHALPAPPAPMPPLKASSLDVRAWLPKNPREEAVPSLLVHAPKRSGSAVERNSFKRRTRMALLALLRGNPAWAGKPWILWIRPAKGAAAGCRLSYQEIEGQLRLALSRLG